MKTIIHVLVFVILTSGLAQAGSGAGAINLSFNTSARFEGLGSAGVGAPWGTDTNHWANPAMLAFRPGVNYLKFHSELAKGLADDIVLTNEELTFGTYGVTFLLAKGPVAGNFLDMGEQMGTDENGMATGVFQSYMKAKSWGLGVDIVQMLDLVRGLGDQGMSRYASLAIGYTRTEFEEMQAPAVNLQDAVGGGNGSGTVTDKGFVLRVTPLRIDVLGGDVDESFVGFTGGLAYGYNLHADTDEFIVRVDADQADPFPRAFLRGWSAHLALPLTPAFKARPTSSFGRLMTEAIDPIVSFTYSSQLNEPGYAWTGTDYEYEHDTSGVQEEKGHGWELGLANIFYLRRGHFTALYGGIDADTSGWGVNLQIGRMGGFRYDQATVPQASGLPNVERQDWSLWIDPMAIANRR